MVSPEFPKEPMRKVLLFLPTQLADLQLDPFIFLLLLFLKPFGCSEFYSLAIFNSLHLHKHSYSFTATLFFLAL